MRTPRSFTIRFASFVSSGKAFLVLGSLALFLLIGTSSVRAQGTFTASADGDWGSGATWTLNSGSDVDGIPDADDTVTIPNTRVVTVSSPQSVRNLTVNAGGTLTLNDSLSVSGVPSSSVANSGTTSGVGPLRTDGTTALNIGGTFTAAMEINSGTTTTGSSTIGGSITVFNGAILRVQGGGFSATHNGDLTVDTGGLLDIVGASAFRGNGANIVINGSVTGNIFRFNGTTQNLSGTGSFTNDTIQILVGSTTTLTSNMTVGDGVTSISFTVNGSGHWRSAAMY